MIVKRIAITVFLLISTSNLLAQTVDFENVVKSKKFRVTGNTSANAVFYQSNRRSARSPFTYFLQGSINVSWFSFSMPFSYSLTNQGENLSYKVPFDFNRLSLHPKYKWIQGHIGNVTMNFSPYTLNGHQFTGGGLELTPKGPFKIALMYGRLLRAIPYDENPKTVPAYERTGYGAKLGWEKDAYKLSVTGFYAKDDINSIAPIPEEKNKKPKENLVISLGGETTLAKNYTIRFEYASTAITQDLRADKLKTNNGGNIASLFFDNRASTEYYYALKTGLDVKIAKMKVGLGYERIDPQFETLGAYYFNNDFENITLNASRAFFRGKLNVSFNIGYQRDNLDSQKKQSTSRNVGSFNATYQATEKINVTASYSNFSTFTNKNLNQFDDINDGDLTDEDIEALRFKQLSQNSNINVNWMLQQKEVRTQNLNVNYSLAASANVENDIIRVGQANNFHNAGTTYTIGFPKQTLNVATSLNYNYSDIGKDDSQSWGTSLNINKTFFENLLNTTIGSSYNKSFAANNSTSDVLNIRGNASITVAKKHNFNVSAVQLFRNAPKQDLLKEFTMTFGYAYSFTVRKPKFKFPKFNKKVREFEFTYKKQTFKGAHNDISNEITTLIELSEFNHVQRIGVIKDNLALLEKNMRENENKKNRIYKKSAIDYLSYLYKHQGFLKTYNDLAFESLKKLYEDAKKMDYRVKKDYEKTLARTKEKIEVTERDTRILATKERKYKAHMWMKEELEKIAKMDVVEGVGILYEFRNKNIAKVFKMLEEGKSREEVKVFLEVLFADFYHKKSIKTFK